MTDNAGSGGNQLVLRHCIQKGGTEVRTTHGFKSVLSIRTFAQLHTDILMNFTCRYLLIKT